MRIWRERKKSHPAAGKSLGLEKLEDRAMLATLSLVSGQVTSFQDADGTQVHVKLTGPGQGTLELVGGVLTGAAIDTLELSGTTGASKLKISARGGSVHGTTINDLAIEKAVGESAALRHLKAKKLGFNDGGQLTVDGDIGKLYVRSFGKGATVDVDGNVGRLKTHALGADAMVDVSDTLQRFVAHLLESGSQVSASQIDMLKVKDQALGATIDVGDGGLVRAKLKNTYASNIASDGDIGNIVFRGDTMGVNIVSNIDAGSDGVYGTIDDFVIDPAMSGNIDLIRFSGYVGAEGTNQEVGIVTSGEVSQIALGRHAKHSGHTPTQWERAAYGSLPLAIVQQAAQATGYSDDDVWVAIFGQELGSGPTAGKYYYLDPNNINGNGFPTPQVTSGTASPSTPNLPLIPSATLSQWKNATKAWGSDLAFPIPRNGNEWSGRILISVGAPVQAQVNANGSVASPSASDTIDASTGTFYDFLEFTVTAGATVATSSLDIDTSLVDAFGLPMALQLFRPNSTTFTGTTTASSATITGITSTTGLAQGQFVIGTGIPAGAIIDSVTPSTMSVPGSITLNVPVSASGTPSLTAWTPYQTSFTGTATVSSTTLTNVTNLQSMVLNDDLGTGQPVTSTGILAAGTTIVAYDIDAQTITLSKPAIASTPAMSSTTFTFDAAGPVGVEATRQAILGTGASSLNDFLQQKIAGGSDAARPFLESAFPYLISGPVPIFGASNDANDIVITTTGTSVLQTGDQVTISGVTGNTAANGTFTIKDVTTTSFTLDGVVGNGAYTGFGTWTQAITGASNADPIVITTANTAGLANGDLVEVTGVEGNTAANGVYFIDNVTATTFELRDSTGNAAYTSGGTWKAFTAIPRLVSPKDLVESLSNPQDLGALNNYFNELVDDFFLKYLPSDQMVGSMSGGGETLKLTSTASGSAVEYDGTVTNTGTTNGGYVLRFKPSGSTAPGPTTFDPNSLDIYYPFFTTNAPSADLYTPLFGVESPPSWITTLGKQNESASQMLFACDAVFADNAARQAAGMSPAQATIVADLENLVSGAFNRGIALNAGDTWSDSSTWFPTNGTYNYWVEYWHQDGLAYGDLAYAFAYDDKFGASTNLDIANVGLTQITLGSWSATLTPSTTSVTSSVSAAVAQNASVTLTATVSGSPSTGTVSFFVNGIPINANNDSNSAPLEPVAVAGGTASLTANLPSLPTGNHTYTVTAVYSGDGTLLPSIGTTTVEISG